MDKAIKLAIEGGYRKDKVVIEGENLLEITDMTKLTALSGIFLLDPLFWQFLGKSMGWPENRPEYLCPSCRTIGIGKTNHMSDCSIKDRHTTWRINWHRFIDHLISGGNIDEFFEKLIK